jgi:hypothetical protein
MALGCQGRDCQSLAPPSHERNLLLQNARSGVAKTDSAPLKNRQLPQNARLGARFLIHKMRSAVLQNATGLMLQNAHHTKNAYS